MENGENVVLVSSHLKYKKETLKPHDKITFLMKDKNGKQEEIDYTVTGIFTPLENKYSDITKDIPYFYVPNQNIVYLSNKYIENSPTEFGMNRGRIYLQSNLICVNEPKNLEAFTNYAKEILEGSEITFETTEDSVSEILKPVENFASMSKNIVGYSMAAMSIVVALISFYFIKDRKYEIGIYKSMGLRKAHLLIQFLLEILLVGWLGIGLSIGSGQFIAKHYSDYIIDSEVKIQQEEMMKYMGIENENEILSDYEIKVNGQQIEMLIMTGTISLTISAIVPLIYIMSFNPKKILI